jgi:integrase/recombinase XerD
MAQAKTLTVRELRKTLDHLPVNKYRLRNRLMLLMTHWSGMRVGEVAALSIGDVRNVDGTVKNEIRLDATQTKGKHARIVFVNDRLRKEIASYLKAIVTSDPSKPLFKTQKRSAFSANTLCQTLNGLYRHAGIDGATSHSGRRSFITTLASKGIGVRVLAALAGHRSIATTQAYIDVNDEMKRAAVELVT